MTRTVAEHLIDIMLEAGVRNVYGVGGDSANPVADAIRRTDGKLRFVYVRTEEAGAFAAGADAQISGHPTAVLGSSGPGSLHLVDAGLVLIAIGAFGSIDAATKLGAASLVISALLALYIATAQMWNLTYKRTVLPLYPWK